jgi:polyphosphate kinase
VESVFNLLANQSKIPRLNKLMIAPFQLQRSLIEKVEKTAHVAAQGVASRIILKMNTLTDEKLMEALVHAGQAGVQIDLIIRGACMLPAQRLGVTDNIRVRSIIGRFLEHSRVFYFRTGNDESLYLSSADWMNRNMLRRVELAWPVEDAALRQRVIDECLVAYLHDNVDAWSLNADGQYTRVQPAKPKRTSSKATQPTTPVPLHGAQAALMALYAAKL